MQPPVFLTTRMRFVAGIDEGALNHGIQAHFCLEEIGTLRDLIERGFRAVLGPNLARPAKNLAAHDEGDELLDNQTKRGITIQQKILVIPVAVALVIAVVLVEKNLLPSRQDLFGCDTALIENTIPCLFVADEVADGRAFGRCILRVSVIQIVPRTIRKDFVYAQWVWLVWDIVDVIEGHGLRIETWRFLDIVPKGRERYLALIAVN